MNIDDITTAASISNWPALQILPPKPQWQCPKHGPTFATTLISWVNEQYEPGGSVHLCMLCLIEKAEELGVHRVTKIEQAESES